MITVIHICSVITNEIVTPQKVTHCHDNSNRYMFIESVGKIDIVWRKKRERLQPGDIVIAQRFSLANHGHSPEAVRGFIFEWNTIQPDQLRDPFILRHQDALTMKIVAVVSPLFTESNCTLTSLMDVGRCCQPLFHTLLTEPNHSSETRTAAPTGPIDPRLLTVNRYIREHYMLPLTLPTLADLIQCNPVYLSNTYSKVFRISPIKYLQQLKMSKAQDWLLHTNWSINDIANHLGYVSSSQFADLFKRYYGETPTKFRQTHFCKQQSTSTEEGLYER